MAVACDLIRRAKDASDRYLLVYTRKRFENRIGNGNVSFITNTNGVDVFFVPETYKEGEAMMNTPNDNGIIIDVHTHSGDMNISNFTRYKSPYFQDIIDLYEKARNNNVSRQIVF